MSNKPTEETSEFQANITSTQPSMSELIQTSNPTANLTELVVATLIDNNRILSERLKEIENYVRHMSSQVNRIEKTTNEVRSLVGPIGIPMPDGEMLVQTLYGVKYLIDPNDIIMAPNLIVYRQWESDLSSYIWNSLNPNSVFVDIGANFGYFTCLAASRIGRSGSGQVFAIEPNPNCLRLIDKNIMINWSMAPVTIFRGAAGENEGKAKLAIPRNRAANASLSVNALSVDDVNLTDVSIKPLDSIIPADLIVDFLKIDVEGHEFAALSGAKSVISRSKNIKIILEWSPSQMKDAGYTAQSMHALFSSLSLRPFRMTDSGLLETGEATPISGEELVKLDYDNLILTH